MTKAQHNLSTERMLSKNIRHKKQLSYIHGIIETKYQPLNVIIRQHANGQLNFIPRTLTMLSTVFSQS